MKYVPASDVLQPTFAGSLLLLPSVSIGNVGQLAVDLIISTLQLQRLGYFESPDVLPCLGIDDEWDLVTPLELYGSSGSQLVVLQQRSPAVVGRQRQLAEDLASWVQESGFSKVVLVASLDATLRQDRQLEGAQIRFLSTDEAGKAQCSALGWQELEEHMGGEKPEEKRVLPPWPFVQACRVRNVALVGVVAFAVEGDNIPDAFRVADCARKLLASDKLGGVAEVGPDAKQDWIAPKSWQHVYGPPRSQMIY